MAPLTLLTLCEILDLDVVGEAGPEVLAGQDALDRPVRWVHSSEIYEIGPLLSGGELLLTSGLGLAGADPGARRHWVRELAACGVAGVAFEVGRSLPDVPAEVVEESRRLGLPLVALRRVVPFVQITEAANTAIITHALAARAAVHERPDRAAQAAALLSDLVDGRVLLQSEVPAAADFAGYRVVGVCAYGLPAVADAMLDRAVRTLGGRMLRAGFPRDTLALVGVAGSRDPVRTVADALRAAVGERDALTVVVGHAVAEWPRWGETLRSARTALELALTVPAPEPVAMPSPGGTLVTSSRALALERELIRGGIEANRERLRALVADTLGPLLEWDAVHPSDLVRTLEVHLRNGCSPTRTAALLHVGRQSLYQRLERIEILLGVAVTDPELQGELLVAACAFRILRGAGSGVFSQPPARFWPAVA